MLFTKKLHFLFMAPSLSSLLSNSTHHFICPNPNTNFTHRRYPPISTFVPNATQKNQNLTPTPPPPPPPPQNEKPTSEKRSLAVATGEIFLGIASRLLKRSNRAAADNFETIPLMERRRKKESGDGEDYEERIGAVMEDEIEPEVIWEQRVKDIEAEKERRVVTSPGFSFSAAGLLFPYHLGVAQFLIEKGYIKVCCYVLGLVTAFF